MAKAKVAVLKTKPETVIDDYLRLFELAEMERHLDKSAPVILKDNISWQFMYPAANTTPWQLEATITGLKQTGYKDISCVQNDTVVTNPFVGERENKYVPIFREHQLPVLFNFRESDMKWVEYKPKGELLVLPRIYPEGIFIPDYFIGKNVVHLPTLKCHVYTTYTGALKNAFGGLLHRKRHYTHTWIHETLVDLLTIQREIHPGMFNVMDGTTAGDGPGPRTMRPIIADLILASGDPVAIDAVAAKILGFDPMKIPCIYLSHERGLGVGDPGDIEIVGHDISSTCLNCKVGYNPATRFVSLFWFGPFKWLQKLLFHTPLVYFFVVGSYVFHDYLWYPFIGKKRIRDWLDGTHWGKLFQKYPY